MPILLRAFNTPLDCALWPEKLFVFGDNLERKGFGGQAIIRNSTNAVGLPTKRQPSKGELAYLTDKDYIRITQATQACIGRLQAHLSKPQGQNIVIWPLHGIGTGRAKLRASASQIAEFYRELFNELNNAFGAAKTNPQE